LVAENEVLKGNITTGAEAGKQTAEEQDDEMDHRAGYHPVPPSAADSSWTAFCPPSGLKKSERSMPIADRDLVWSIISTVANEPGGVADHSATDQQGAPGEASANSVPGAVLSVAIEYGKWIDQNSEHTDGMRSVPELAALLERQFEPEMQRDPAGGEVFGRYFPTLRFFDKAWTQAHVEDIFSLSPAGTRAWRTFLIFWGAYSDAFQEIRHLYSQSVQGFPRVDVPEDKASDWARDLAEHLIVYRAWVGIEEGEADLLDEFFEKAPVDLRRHALEYPGFVLSRNDAEPPPAGTIERLMKVWESREAHYAEANTPEAMEEMQSYGYWFTSGAFPVDWSVAHLVRALELAGKVDNEHQVVARLAALDDAYLGSAVSALMWMSAEDDDPWKILGWGSDGHSILERGRRSPDERVAADTVALVSRLLRRGYDSFKDLAVSDSL
jgi:hypothetical protein